MLIFLCFISILNSVSGDETADFLRMSDREIIQHLVSTVHTQQKRIEGLERLAVTVETQQKRIEGLEGALAQQNDVIRELQRKIQDTEEGIVSEPKPSADDFPDYKSEEFPQSRAARSIPRSSKISPRFVSDTPVAFSALASHSLNHLGTNQNLVFDVTNVNTNNVYNPHHGVFTVSVTGIYVITSSVMANADREVLCDMVVNGIVKAQIFARGTDNRPDQGTNTILLHLNRGDDVSIKNNLLDDSVYGSLYTTFSGFLLYEEEEPTSIVG